MTSKDFSETKKNYPEIVFEKKKLKVFITEIGQSSAVTNQHVCLSACQVSQREISAYKRLPQKLEILKAFSELHVNIFDFTTTLFCNCLNLNLILFLTGC